MPSLPEFVNDLRTIDEPLQQYYELEPSSGRYALRTHKPPRSTKPVKTLSVKEKSELIADIGLEAFARLL